MDYNFSDLILLIGTNPLPNFVAARYFLKNVDALKRIWMICSEDNKNIGQRGTKKYAENLQKIIRKEDDKVKFGEIKYIKNVNNKMIIVECAQNLLEQLSNKQVENAHLFYTGGTKSEVVHTYNTFDNYQSINFTFSYLSARNFRIYFDDHEYPSDDLRKIIKLGLEDLLFLHNYSLDHKREKTEFTDTVEKFEELINNDKISEFYNSKNGYRESYAFSKNNKDYVFNDTVKEVLATKPDDDEKIGEFKNYITGFWFEDYIRKIIRESNNVHYDQLLKSVEPSQEPKFELDLALMKGYQLIGISCTISSSKKTCKLKGLEVILRTRQIGGTESKAILITGIDDRITLKMLQQELLHNTGTSKENILVLGVNNWKSKKLTKKLAYFI